MTNLKIHYLLVLLLLHFSKIICNDKYFVLKNPSSGLVLDRSEGWVTLQTFTGFSSQLWKLEPVKEGKSYIVSKYDGKVLDYDSRYRLGDTWVVVNEKINSTLASSDADQQDKLGDVNLCQLWYVHYHGIIVNACDNGKIAVTAGNYPGSYVRTKDISGNRNQMFVFQYL